jgi:predicted DNA-binding transcriptional regulator AlpA
MQPQSNKPLVSSEQAREEMGFSQSTLYRMVKGGTFPSPVKISKRRVAFKREDLDSWKKGLVLQGQALEVKGGAL